MDREPVSIDIILELDHDPRGVVVVLAIELDELPAVLTTMGTEQFREQLLDTVSAGVAAAEMGIRQTRRSFGVINDITNPN